MPGEILSRKDVVTPVNVWIVSPGCESLITHGDPPPEGIIFTAAFLVQLAVEIIENVMAGSDTMETV